LRPRKRRSCQVLSSCGQTYPEALVMRRRQSGTDDIAGMHSLSSEWLLVIRTLSELQVNSRPPHAPQRRTPCALPMKLYSSEVRSLHLLSPPKLTLDFPPSAPSTCPTVIGPHSARESQTKSGPHTSAPTRLSQRLSRRRPIALSISARRRNLSSPVLSLTPRTHVCHQDLTELGY
jgi:hypothetical protein